MNNADVRTLVIALSVLAMAGCSDVSSPDGPMLSVSLTVQEPMAVAPMLRVDIGGRPVEVSATGPLGDRTEVRGPRYGEVPVAVALVSGAGDTLAHVAFSQQFRRHSSHWVTALVGRHRPFGHCIGALEVMPVRGGGPDTLFVMYGSIPDGAIC